MRTRRWVTSMQERFYWPGMQGDVAQWIRTCSACTTRESPPQRSRAPLQTVASGFPMQVVAADILGPLPESTAGNSYILIPSRLHNSRLKNYYWLLAVFRAKLPNGQPLSKVVGSLGRPTEKYVNSQNHTEICYKISRVG